MKHKETLQPFSQEENDLQKDVICAYIDRERDTWIEERRLADRAGGMDGDHNRKRDNSMNHINQMLEELIEIEGVRSV